MRRIYLWLAATVLAVACGTGEASKQPAINRDTLTQRQKDSILAGSRIPGASGVGKAMRAADTMSARVRVSDTIQ